MIDEAEAMRLEVDALIISINAENRRAIENGISTIKEFCDYILEEAKKL